MMYSINCISQTQVQKGNYTDASYNALQTAITSVKEEINKYLAFSND